MNPRPICCDQPMRDTGRMVFEEGGSQRVFQNWYCTKCNVQKSLPEVPPTPDPYKRKRV